MKKKLFLPLILFWAVSVSAGTVFFDANNDGIRNNNEPGISGVAVTDGRSIVKTAADGSFSLAPAAGARHIYISVPEGYRANGRFYRTPGEKADFPLVKWQRPARFVQISDGEIAVKRRWMPVIENELRKNPADFLIYTGDIAANTPAGLQFAAKRFTFKRMGVPVYFTIGNHDFTKGKSGDDAYLTNCGPLWYSFDSNGVHFVVVPMIWDGKGQRSDKPVTYKIADFARWVKKDLELQPAGKKIVFFGHAPVFDHKEAVDIIQPQKYDIAAFIHGHNHMCGTYELAGIRHYGVSSVKGGMPFAAYGVYEFDRNGEFRRLHALVDASFSAPAKDKRLIWQWKSDGGSFISADPLVDENKVYAGLSDVLNGKHQGIAAFDRKTGKQVWFFKTANSMIGPMQLKNGTLFAADADGNVYALDSRNGSLKWKNRFSPQNGVFYSQGVVVFENKVIAGFGDHLKGFDANSGKVLWNTKNKRGKKARCGSGAVNVLAGKCVIGADNGKRCAVDAASGKLLWQTGKFNFSAPVYSNGRLFAVNGNILCELDMKTGKVKRTYPEFAPGWGGRFTPLAVRDVLYSGSSDSGVCAVDLKTGKLKWKFLPAPGRAATGKNCQRSVYGSLACSGKVLFCGAADGNVYALDTVSGKKLWSRDCGSPVSGIKLDNGSLFVTAYTGELCCFDVSDIAGSKSRKAVKNTAPGTLDLSAPLLVVPGDAAETTRLAAEEFKEHLELITGKMPQVCSEDKLPEGKFSARVYFGPCRRTAELGFSTDGMRNFEYQIAGCGNELFFIGNDSVDSLARNRKNGGLGISAGTLFAVYDFLDREMGVRYIWPGKSGIYVKKNTSPQIKVPLARKGGHWGNTSRFTASGAHSWSFYKNWKNYKKFDAEQQRWLWRQRFCFPIRQFSAAHSFLSYWKRFGKSNPEFFQMLPDGRRGPLDGDPAGHDVSMCVSNKNFIKQIAKDYKAIYNNKKLRPFNRCRMTVGENDTPGMCTCAGCRAWDAPEEKANFDAHPYWNGSSIPVRKQRFPALGAIDGGGIGGVTPSLANRYCRFYLEVQKELRKINPDVLVFGYSYANYASRLYNVKLNDKIFISFVNIGYYPFTDEKMADFRRNWNDWKNTGASLLLRPNSTHSGHNMPLFYGRRLGEAFLYARNNGAQAVLYDSMIGQWGAQSASYYLIGRLNARPDLTVDQVLEEYYSAFGPARQDIKNFVEFLERTADAVTVEMFAAHAKKLKLNRLPNFKNWLQAADLVFSDKFFVEGEKLLKRAAVSAAGDPDASEKVRFLQVGFEHSKRTFNVLKISRTGDKKALRKAVAELAKYRNSIDHLLTSDMAYLQLRENRQFIVK